MKSIITILSLAALLSSCKTSTDDGGEYDTYLGRYNKAYDTVQKGVQIIEVQADQSFFGDEWITLKTDTPRTLIYWRLNAGDDDQNFSLPWDIIDTLRIYTHTDPDKFGVRDVGLNLSSGKWIWNNSDPDVGKLYNVFDSLVDSMSYKKVK